MAPRIELNDTEKKINRLEDRVSELERQLRDEQNGMFPFHPMMFRRPY